MKVVEIIQRVQSLYSKGCQSDDSRLSPRHIYNKLLTLRSKYIAAQAKKKQKLNQWNFQRLSCIELEKVNPSMCPCQPVPGCDILRTKNPLPKPLSDLNSHLLQSVTSLDGSVVFSEIQWTEVKYKASNKYTSKKPDYFIDGGHLYLIGVTQTMRHLKMITVVGLFEDPVEVERANDFCDCSNEDVEIIEKNISYVTQEVVESTEKEVLQETIEIGKKESHSNYLKTGVHVFVFYDMTSLSILTLRRMKRNVLTWYMNEVPEDTLYEDLEFTRPLEELSSYEDGQLLEVGDFGSGFMNTQTFGNSRYLHHINDSREAFLGLPQRILSDASLASVGVARQGGAHDYNTEEHIFDYVGEDYSGEDVIILSFMNDAEIHYHSDLHTSNWNNGVPVSGVLDCRDNANWFTTWDLAQPTSCGEEGMKHVVGTNALEAHDGQIGSYYGYVQHYQAFLKIFPLFKTFMGIQYPIVNTQTSCKDFAYSAGAIPTYLGMMKGRDYTQEEVDSLPVNEGFINIYTGVNLWENVKNLLKNNVYKNLTDADGDPGLEKYNWRVKADKNTSNIPTEEDFPEDINALVDDVLKDTIITVEETFEWAYDKTFIELNEGVKFFSYEIQEGCCDFETVEKEVVIEEPIYTVENTVIPKVHTETYIEAYIDEETGDVLEREVTKEFPYVEEHQEAVAIADTQTLKYEVDRCIGKCVSPLDTDFAVDNEFIDYMLSEASEELVTFFGGQKEDLTNDTKDNIVEESK